jgi:hypothetical protein
MGTVMEMPKRTYVAKLHEVQSETGVFKTAGTLDGFIDLAVPRGGTYQLNLSEARGLIAALSGTIADVEANCMYERDSLLVK